MDKKSTRSLIVVRWNDASYERGESRVDDMRVDCVLVTIGHEVKTNYTKTHVSVAMDWFADDKTHRHIQHIPKGMIVSIRRFRVAV